MKAGTEAVELTQHYLNSQELAKAIADFIIKRERSALEIAFALEVIEVNLREQVPNWDGLRDFTRDALDGLVKMGLRREGVPEGDA